MAESDGYCSTRSRLCRYAIYESGFAAFDIAFYSSQLYPDKEALSPQDNVLLAAKSFGLCKDTCAGTDIITRGEAADLLYALLTREFTVALPPILERLPLNNKEGVHLNSYLLELQKSRSRSVRYLQKRAGSI